MDNLTFEAAIARLEEISKILSEGASLEKSMELYEEGTTLAAFCSEQLKNAEQKLTTLERLKGGQDDA